MKILNLCKFLALFFAITCCQATEGPDQYWAGYQAAKKAGKVRNPLGYLDVLSTRDQGEPIQSLEPKKDAILWFMATGGKKGFANRSATKEERVVMEKALMFAALVNELTSAPKIITMGEIRAGFGPRQSDKKIITHLMEAQKIISSTRILWQADIPEEGLKDYINQVFNLEFIKIPFLLRSLSSRQGEISIAPLEVLGYRFDFSRAFTIERNRKAKRILNDLGFRYNDPTAYFGFREPITRQSAAGFQEFVLKNSIPDPAIFGTEQPSDEGLAGHPPYRAVRVMTENGVEIIRNTEGWVRLVPRSQGVKFGRSMTLGVGSVTDSDDGKFFGLLDFGAEKTEQEFLDAIRIYSRIVELTYI